jgi:hypothetical protein
MSREQPFLHGHADVLDPVRAAVAEVVVDDSDQLASGRLVQA